MTSQPTAYHLGIDLGTTYVAAGLLQQGRPEIVTLGDRAPVLPSVLYFKEDGEVLTGESATRRGLSDPTRVVREFKRRVGDATPLVVGQAPYSVDVLMAKLLRFVYDAVVERQGSAPRSIAVTHPANWGPYKIDVLEQAVRMAEIGEVMTITEPVAAAIHYAAAERLEPGQTVAVYDLGGGTFDAAVLRKTDDEFTVLGEVEGIERLGGIDFDEAVFQHVIRFCESALAELDMDDPAAIQALARLRQECVDAKEVLSTDTDATIPVVVPSLQTEVRLTRAEFEAMIRPLLQQTVEALRRAIRSAEVDPQDLSAVLLVGGSSRIPLIGEMVGAELARPIAVDRHPKHTVALGAAISAGRSAEAPEPEVDDWFRTVPTPPVPVGSQPEPEQAHASNAPLIEEQIEPPESSAPAPAASVPGPAPSVPASAPSVPPPAEPPAVAAGVETAAPQPTVESSPLRPVAPSLAATQRLTLVGPEPAPSFGQHQLRAPTPAQRRPGGRALLVAGIVAATLLILGGAAVAFSRSGDTLATETAGEAETAPPGDAEQDASSTEDPGSPSADQAGAEGNDGNRDQAADQARAGGDNGGDQAAEPDATERTTSTTGRPTTTTEPGESTTTTSGSTTTTEATTTTTEPTTTTTTTTPTTTTETTISTPVPIRIVSGPRVNTVGSTSFQFSYETNDVCGTGSFRVVEVGTGTPVGSFTGADGCFGPNHGGYPGRASSAEFSHFDIKPGTTYRVFITVRGTASDGTRPAGSGSDSASLDVTTAE